MTTTGHICSIVSATWPGQKGTGKWSVSAALDRNDPLTLIAEAVFARMLSALPDERRTAAEGYPDPQAQSVVETLTAGQIRAALYASKLVSYAQGFSLMRRVSELYDWRLDYGTIARIWRNGCIIRSAFLEKVTEAFRTDPDLRSLLFDDFSGTRSDRLCRHGAGSWRTVRWVPSPYPA